MACSIFLHAQAPAIGWQNTIGGYNDDYLNFVEQTTDGGYILGGDSNSGANGDKTESRIGVGGADYWVVKLDSFGAIEWQNTIGGTSTEALKAVFQTTDGGFIIGGYSQSGISGDKTEVNIGGYDYWIVKLDALGNIQWQNTIGGNSNDKLNCIIQTDDDGYLMGGESQSNISGDKTENSKGGDDYWVVKTNSLGSIEWQNTFGGVDYDGLFSIDKTADGGFILGGYSLSGISGDKTENNIGGSYDYWILKIDNTGNILWQNDIGGNASDKLKKVYLTIDNGFILGGTSSSGISGDKSEVSHSDDYWVVKTDANGNILWQNTISGVAGDVFYDIVQAPDGSFIVGGSSSSVAGYDKSESRIGAGSLNDYWIVKLNNLGNILWENTIGGDKADDFRSLTNTIDGGCIVGGSSLSNIFADKTEANWNTSTNDWWAVKINSDVASCEAPTGLYADNITTSSAKLHWSLVPGADSYKVYYRESAGGVWIKKNATTNAKTISGLLTNTSYDYKIKSNCGAEMSTFSVIETFTTLPFKLGIESSDEFLSVYPNPTKGLVTINFIKKGFEGNRLVVKNILGEEVINLLNIEENITIDLSKFSPGIYFINLTIGTMDYYKKVIKT